MSKSSASATATTLHGFPFSLPFSGRVNETNGATVVQGSNGSFWGAGADSATNARRLYFNSANNVGLEGNDYKTRGYSIRCLGKLL